MKRRRGTTPRRSRSLGRVIAGSAAAAVATALVATAFATRSNSAPPAPPPQQQDASQTCTQANAAIGQVLAMPATTLPNNNNAKLQALSAQLHSLANRAEDDVVQEHLDDVADAVRAFGAAVQAGDASAAIGARDVVAGFARTCPVANALSGTTSTGWAPSANSSLAAAQPGGPLGGNAVTVSAGAAGSCGIHDAAPTVSSTLPGTYRLRVWVRSASGAQPVTVHVDELVGASQVNQAVTTVTATTGWQRVELSLRPAAPKRSALSVGISTTAGAAGACVAVGAVSMTWG